MTKSPPTVVLSLSTCLFCDLPANSGEHMWSKWMRPYFERTPHDKTLETTFRLGRQDPGDGNPRIGHGHPTNRKVKAVCRSCNNGWMGTLEEDAKPNLERMIQGRSVRLDSAAQLILARWITLKMMVWEQTNPPTAVFERPQTLAFAASSAIPTKLKIRLLLADDGGFANVSRAYAALFPEPLFVAGQVTPAMRETPNLQTLLLGIGKLLIFAECSNLPDIELEEFRRAFAKTLWPSARSLITWPPRSSVTAAERQHLSLTLDRYLKQPENIGI